MQLTKVDGMKPQGRAWYPSLDELLSPILQVVQRKEDASGTLYAKAKDNYRKKENIEEMYGVVLDIDKSPTDVLPMLVEALQGYQGYINTTFSHDPRHEKYCYRAFIKSESTIKPEDYEDGFINLVHSNPILSELKEKGILDMSAKDVGRFFYDFSCPPSRENDAYFHALEGMPLIPDTHKRENTEYSSGNQLAKQPINELLKGSVEGTRHNDCIRISGMLFNKGMSLQDVIQLMLGWNTKCIPPRVDKEVIDEVENIYSKYHSDNPFTAEETVIASEAEDIEFKFLGREDRENLPSVDWYIDRLFRHKGIGSIIGQERNGKSFVAIDLACRISRGMDFFGHETRGMKPVLYVPLEDWSGINLRIKGWEKYHGVEANVILLPEDTSLGF